MVSAMLSWYAFKSGITPQEITACRHWHYKQMLIIVDLIASGTREQEETRQGHPCA
jgi:hypothetical protein